MKRRWILSLPFALPALLTADDVDARKARISEERGKRVVESKERGKQFEEEVKGRLKDREVKFDDQVRVRTAKTGRIAIPDDVVKRSDGYLTAVEAKSGATARLSENQEALRREGGVVISSGKKNISEGDVIKRHRVAIARDAPGNDAQARKQQQ